MVQERTRGKGSITSAPLRGRLVATFWDKGFEFLTLLAALMVLSLVLVIVYNLFRGALPSISKYGLGFITSSIWDPVFHDYGALPFIFGTVASALLGLFIALPLSIGVAVFLSEFAKRRVRKLVGFVIEILASIPSVIYGLWGVFVLIPALRSIQPGVQRFLGGIPFFQGPPFGYNLLAAGVILAIMVTPTITSLTRDALQAVPTTQREGSLALGATRFETLWHVVLPYNLSAIIGASVLGLGRALGETMAVTMVIGNMPNTRLSLFMPAQTMASLIANEFAESTDKIHLSALIEMGLLLFLVTLLMNAAAKILLKRRQIRA